jgi:rSAM/selenodomain-associated transferase 1
MVDLQGENIVAILTRAPSAGGKTRLFRDLGCAPDPELLAAFLLDTLDAVATPGARCVACFSPPDAEREMRTLVPAGVHLVPQRGGDLGERMRFVFDDLFARGAASVVLVGSDLPDLNPSVVPAAFRILGERPHAVVLGPARDGGYYLVAATRTPTLLFTDVPWSTSNVLAATERRGHAAGMEIVKVAVGRDVDTVHDLRALIGSHAAAPRTRSVVHTKGLLHC